MKNEELTEKQEKKIKDLVKEFSDMCIETCNTLLRDEEPMRTVCVLILLEWTLHSTNNIIRKIKEGE